MPDADILVNNVGTAYLRDYNGVDDIAAIPDADWLGLFQLNVMSGVRATRHYLPRMVRRGWGRVVFVSSESAVNIPKEMLDYGMTKTAQLAVSRGLAEAVAGTGVTVNAVLPGPTRSEILGNFMAEQAKANGMTQEEAEQGFLRAMRPTTPDRTPRHHGRGRQHDRLRLFGTGLGDQRRRAPRRRRRGPIRRLALGVAAPRRRVRRRGGGATGRSARARAAWPVDRGRRRRDHRVARPRAVPHARGMPRVNPDCALKTRVWFEFRRAVVDLSQAARRPRATSPV